MGTVYTPNLTFDPQHSWTEDEHHCEVLYRVNTFGFGLLDQIRVGLAMTYPRVATCGFWCTVIGLAHGFGSYRLLALR